MFSFVSKLRFWSHSGIFVALAFVCCCLPEVEERVSFSSEMHFR
jgi:hypothetical protein